MFDISYFYKNLYTHSGYGRVIALSLLSSFGACGHLVSELPAVVTAKMANAASFPRGSHVRRLRQLKPRAAEEEQGRNVIQGIKLS